MPPYKTMALATLLVAGFAVRYSIVETAPQGSGLPAATLAVDGNRSAAPDLGQVAHGSQVKSDLATTGLGILPRQGCLFWSIAGILAGLAVWLGVAQTAGVLVRSAWAVLLGAPCFVLMALQAQPLIVSAEVSSHQADEWQLFFKRDSEGFVENRSQSRSLTAAGAPEMLRFALWGVPGSAGTDCLTLRLDPGQRPDSRAMLHRFCIGRGHPVCWSGSDLSKLVGKADGVDYALEGQSLALVSRSADPRFELLGNFRGLSAQPISYAFIALLTACMSCGFAMGPRLGRQLMSREGDRMVLDLRRWGPTVALVLACLVYVGNAWTPTSYAISLQTVGAEDTGLVLGTPRPIRSDEFGLFTPLLQATVNNDYRRFNATSLYQEDLRSTVSQPLRDWGMLFKPTSWGFLFLSPAYALSLYYCATMISFLVGYTLLFRRGGIGRWESMLLATGLFFTPFAQYWWTSFGPLIASFPWILVVAAHRNTWWKLPIFYWAACSWMLSFFYPGVIATSAFVGLFMAACHRWVRGWKEWLALGCASLLACLTVVVYLRDYLTATQNTLYPGVRRFSGGMESFGHWLSVWAPNLHIDLLSQESLTPLNVCEVSTLGTFYGLALLFFMDWRRLGEGRWKKLLVLSLPVGLMWLWMLAPIPQSVGRLLLWDWVQPQRMQFAMGFALLWLLSQAAKDLGLQITWPRSIALVEVVVAAWYFKAQPRPDLWEAAWRDLAFIAPVIIVMLASPWLSPRWKNRGLLAGSALAGAVAFGVFNPLQSAKPIFKRPWSARFAQFDAQVAADPDGVLRDGRGFFGAQLNGWGYRSVGHFLLTPHFDHFRAMYPDMDDQHFNFIFNRYAMYLIDDVPAPFVRSENAVILPLSDALRPGQVEVSAVAQ